MDTTSSLTPIAEDCLEDAHARARHDGYPYLTPDYLLLGMANDTQSVAHHALQECSIDISMLNSRLSGHPPLTRTVTGGLPQASRRMLRVIELARDIADDYEHLSITTGDLLIAVVEEGTSTAGRLLAQLGCTGEKLRSCTAMEHQGEQEHERQTRIPTLHSLPLWAFPPPDERGVPLHAALSLGETDRGALAITEMTVFDTGVLISLTANCAAGETFSDPAFGVGATADDPRTIVFAVHLSTGGRAELLPVDPTWDVLTPPLAEPPTAGITLVSMPPAALATSSFAHRRIDTVWWLWPLPPKGVHAIVTRWESAGIESSVPLDGSRLREAKNDLPPRLFSSSRYSV